MSKSSRRTVPVLLAIATLFPITALGWLAVRKAHGAVPTCEWHRDGPTNCLPARQNSDWNRLVQSNDESEAELRLNYSVEMPPVDATGKRALSILLPDDHILGPAEYWFGHGNCVAAAARRTE